MAQTTSRATRKNGILIATLCILGGCGGPILAFMLLMPKIMDDSRNKDGANPRLVLVTPVSGPKSGHVFLVMEWMQDYILVSPAPLKVASKVDLDTGTDDHFVEQGARFRLASLGEVKALHLPYQRSYKTQIGAEPLLLKPLAKSSRFTR